MPIYCIKCPVCDNKYEFIGSYNDFINWFNSMKPCCSFCYRERNFDKQVMVRDFQAEGMNFQLKGQCWSSDDYNRTEGDRQKSYVQQKKMLPEHLDTGYPRDEDYEPKTLYFHGK